jgi:ribose/xylose/arabinose/galactoside ABC-type transport system permease subunit
MTRWIRIAVIVVLALAAIVLAATTERYLTWDNARAILSASTGIGIVAIGAGYITIVGSLGSLATSQSVSLLAMIFIASQLWGLPAAILIAVIVGAALGAAQGFAIGAWAANPIVLTVAVSFALVGLSTWLTGGRIVAPTGQDFVALNATPFGIPVAVYVLVGLGIVNEFVMRFTTLGRMLPLIGENRRAAIAAGLPVTTVTVFAWTMFGVMSGIGAAFLGAFNRQANISLAGNLTFDVIAAVLVGGIAIAGGRGSAIGATLGAVAISAITNLLLLRGFDTGGQLLVKGLLVVVIVVVLQLRRGAVTR